MNDKIEEFAKGIAKPPSEQTLEVLLEKVVKPDSRTPMKDYTSMAQRQGAGEQARPLDFDRGQGNQQQRAQGNQQSWGQRDQQSQELRSTGDNVAVQGQFKQAVKPQEPGVGTQGSEAPQMPLITGKQAARNGRT